MASDGGAPLRDKVVLITGASRGVGREAALLLGRAGARVVVAARTAESLGAVADELGREGIEALAVPTDIQRSEDCAQLVSRTLERFGRLDVLVNNAGVGTWARVEQTADDEWERVLASNLNGAFYCTRAALPALRESRGSVITIVSNLGRVGSDGWAAYCASKFGTVGLFEALSWELYGSGVRLILLYPGLIATEFHRSMPNMPDLAGVPALHPRQVAEVMLEQLRREPGERIEHVSFDDVVPAVTA